jgi:hypothetical protein
MAGWAFRATRPLHLSAQLLTAFSWLVLGLWYGLGYCFCTDWHWRVREALGRPVQSRSYIRFLLLEVTGVELPAQLADTAVVAVFALTFVLSAALNIRDHRRRARARRPGREPPQGRQAREGEGIQSGPAALPATPGQAPTGRGLYRYTTFTIRADPVILRV